MRTNIDLDDHLIEQAQKLSKAETKREAVNKALDYYVRYLKRRDLLELEGKVEWEGDPDETRRP